MQLLSWYFYYRTSLYFKYRVIIIDISHLRAYIWYLRIQTFIINNNYHRLINHHIPFGYKDIYPQVIRVFLLVCIVFGSTPVSFWSFEPNLTDDTSCKLFLHPSRCGISRCNILRHSVTPENGYNIIVLVDWTHIAMIFVSLSNTNLFSIFPTINMCFNQWKTFFSSLSLSWNLAIY